MLSFIFMEIRLQKILAEMGIASRRKSDELVMEGRVTVNGHVALPGTKADPLRDHIKVDGKLLLRPEPKIYLMMNKPPSVITSLHDPEGRPTVKDFLKGVRQRVHPVGRLDYDSEGLLILTNDGDFTHRLLHPSKETPKTYMVKIKGLIGQDAIKKLQGGVRLEGKMTAPSKVKVVRITDANTWLEMTIREGRKRQIRRMLLRAGHSVLKLKRIRIGSLTLGDLKPGHYRYLTLDEVKKFKGPALNLLV